MGRPMIDAEGDCTDGPREPITRVLAEGLRQGPGRAPA